MLYYTQSSATHEACQGLLVITWMPFLLFLIYLDAIAANFYFGATGATATVLYFGDDYSDKDLSCTRT